MPCKLNLIRSVKPLMISLFILNLSACSNNTSDEAITYASLKDASQIQQQLEEESWNVQNAQSLDFNPFEGVEADVTILAKNKQESLLFVGYFSSEQKAREAFDDLSVPAEVIDDPEQSPYYLQFLVDLDQGFWSINLFEDSVLGYFSYSDDEMESMDSILSPFISSAIRPDSAESDPES